MNFFNENYYSRECALALKEFDIRMAEYAYMEAMIDAKLKINLAKSELKVMMESTAENYKSDLAFLYTEAGKDAANTSTQASGGIWQTIKDLFTKIINAIQHPFTGKNTPGYEEMLARNAKIKMSFDPSAALDSLDQMLAKLGGGDAKDPKALIGIVAAISAAVAAGVGTIKFATNKISMKIGGKGKAEDGTEQSTEEVTEDNVQEPTAIQPTPQDTEMTGQELQGVRQKANNVISRFSSWIGNIEASTKRIPYVSDFVNWVGRIARMICDWIKNNVIDKITNAIHMFATTGKTDNRATKKPDQNGQQPADNGQNNGQNGTPAGNDNNGGTPPASDNGGTNNGQAQTTGDNGGQQASGQQPINNQNNNQQQ